MRKDIYVAALCSEFEQALRHQLLSEHSLKRYRKVLTEFSVYAGDKSYSQSLGVEFLVYSLNEGEGLILPGEHSRNAEYYFRCMRVLAEYFYFGIVHKRSDTSGEIIWPEPFRNCTGKFYESLMKDGLSYGYVTKSRKVIKDLILFLESSGIDEPIAIRAEHNDAFIKSYHTLSPRGIESKLCMLRRYYRYLYLHGYIQIPLAERLPQASIQGRMKFPAVWQPEQIEMIKDAADQVSPSGKRSYAMIMLAVDLGFRIGDLRNLKLRDIDWNKKQVSIVQQKTGKALLLPLTDDAGWAIIDYLKNGRPITDSPNLFVRHKPPYDAFPINSTMNHILSKVMNRAGLPPEKKGNTGWHTFRRSLATNLLQNNVEMSMISEILGHADPDIAGRYYVGLDVENLRKCTLGMEVKDYVRKNT